MIEHDEVMELWERSSEDIGVLAAHIAAILSYRHGPYETCVTFNRILGQRLPEQSRVLHG